ncbi:YHS domain-containing (seleno)protein [Pelagibacterium sp.]|uniref:YHS domain-containing (seleno)protein n=1 Tax=Pelagibacterium sp. TaxID=1967288 RepID=UPI003A936031
MRQIGKQILTLTKSYATLCLLFLALGFAQAVPAQEKSIITNALTGVALSGFDPVAYFTENTATQGSPVNELEWNGVTWYFVSAANRDIFANNPEVYAPLFGGHCAMAMARGHLSDGNPQIFRMVGGRLMLFYSIGNRAAFDMAPGTALASAATNWDALPDRRAGQTE